MAAGEEIVAGVMIRPLLSCSVPTESADSFHTESADSFASESVKSVSVESVNYVPSEYVIQLQV